MTAVSDKDREELQRRRERNERLAAMEAKMAAEAAAEAGEEVKEAGDEADGSSGELTEKHKAAKQEELELTWSFRVVWMRDWIQSPYTCDTAAPERRNYRRLADRLL